MRMSSMRRNGFVSASSAYKANRRPVLMQLMWFLFPYRRRLPRNKEMR